MATYRNDDNGVELLPSKVGNYKDAKLGMNRNFKFCSLHINVLEMQRKFVEGWGTLEIFK